MPNMMVAFEHRWRPLFNAAKSMTMADIQSAMLRLGEEKKEEERKKNKWQDENIMVCPIP